MKLKELLLKMYERHCERLPNETDDDYLQRCGNDMFNQKGNDVYRQNIGTFTRPVIKEITLNTQNEPIMMKIVISDESGSLEDEKKRKEVFRVLERNLKMKQFGRIKYSVSDIMNDIKYYPQTGKIVGNFPKAVFLHPNKLNKINANSLLNTDKCRFKDELEKISKTLEINQKK